MKDPWLCESLRLTALWAEPRDLSDLLPWLSVVGSPPDQRDEHPRQKTLREVGALPEGFGSLELRAAPSRIDWLLVPPLSDAVKEPLSIPNLGSIDAAAKHFADLLFQKAAQAYNPVRVALGINALRPTSTVEASYADLASLLHDVKVPTQGASDLVFQINRPRNSRAEPGVTLNRLSKWMAVSFRGVELMVPLAAGNAVRISGATLTATRAELDISTPADREVELPRATLFSLLNEMRDIAFEILAAGDRP